MINGFSVCIPIRRRTIFPTACLRMLVAHSRLRNEVLLCLDRALPNVVEWTKKHEGWFNEHGIRVLESPFTDTSLKDQFGTANATNHAWRNASHDWLMCMDDDMYVAKDWDLNLARRIRDTSRVYVPVNVVPEIAVERTADWGEWYHLTYPKEYTVGNKYRFTVKESEWLAWSNKTKVNGVYEERCSERILGHWMPIVIHRSVFQRSGGYEAGVGRDINFDTKLGEMSIMKTVVRDSMVLHAKGDADVGTIILDLSAPNLGLRNDNVEA